MDLVDETFVVALPEVVAGIVADPASWQRWWPDLHLVVFMDRGLAGQRWSMTGALVGSLEIWIEPFADGCILHHYLRGNPPRMDAPPDPGPTPQPDGARRLPNGPRRATGMEKAYGPWKYRLEGDRRAGVPPDWATANDGPGQPEQ